MTFALLFCLAEGRHEPARSIFLRGRGAERGRVRVGLVRRPPGAGEMHHPGESAAPLSGQGVDDMQPDNGRANTGEQGEPGLQGEVP